MNDPISKAESPNILTSSQGVQVLPHARKKKANFPCQACCKIKAAEAKLKYSCWDDSKCYNRRYDAKNRLKRLQRYRDQRTVSKVEEVKAILPQEMKWLDAVKLNRALPVLQKRGSTWVENGDLEPSEFEKFLQLLEHLIIDLQCSTEETETDAQYRKELLRIFERNEEQSQLEELPENNKLTKFRLVGFAQIYTSNGRVDGVSHSASVELWSNRYRIDQRTKHFFGVGPKPIKKWIEGVLSEFNITILEQTRFAHERYCPVRPCPIHDLPDPGPERISDESGDRDRG